MPRLLRRRGCGCLKREKEMNKLVKGQIWEGKEGRRTITQVNGLQNSVIWYKACEKKMNTFEVWFKEWIENTEARLIKDA
jgi:hypothetical protein